MSKSLMVKRAWVNGLDIKREQKKKVQKLIGYCPQFNALRPHSQGNLANFCSNPWSTLQKL
jgi:hypothetical protein